MRRGVVAPVLVAMVVAACSSGADAVAPEASFSDLAAAVCPTLWDWQREVGARINEMSAAATAEEDARHRQVLYVDTFADLDGALDRLEEAIAELPPTAHTEAMQGEVTDGITVAHRELADLVAQVQGTAPADEPEGRLRVPTFFGELEKVIDVVKPELARYEDPDLTAAFASLPACQFGVKDVDDGVPRAND